MNSIKKMNRFMKSQSHSLGVNYMGTRKGHLKQERTATEKTGNRLSDSDIEFIEKEPLIAPHIGTSAQ